MKRMIIPLLLGLVLGLGGSVGFALWKGEEEPSLVDAYRQEIGTDSTAQAAADSLAHPDSVAPDSLLVAADSIADVLPADSSDGSALPQLAPDAAPPAATAAMEPQTPIAPERLAKVFGTMQPREAARIMEHMEDGDVQSILGKLGDRQAAAILSNLSPQRAAVISRTVIRGERSSP
jgi:hypothetical protein